MESGITVFVGAVLFAVACYFVLDVFIEDPDVVVVQHLTDAIEWLAFWR